MLIGDLLEGPLRAVPGATAATLGSESITFADLDRRADALVNLLIARGITTGDHIIWWNRTALDSLVALLACGRVGAVFVPVNPRLTADEFTAVVDLVQPVLLVHDQPLPAGITGEPRDDLMAATAEAPAAGPLPPVDPNSAHIAYLTSGSTGVPKAVLVSHRASWLRSCPGGGTFTDGLRGNGGVMSTFPLYHYGGWHYVMEAWLRHTAIHLVDRADAGLITEGVERHRATALYAIPAVWERILDLPDRRDLSSLKHCDTGTSPLAGDLIRNIRSLVPGAATSILYGSTEAGRMSALRDWEIDQRPASVGRAAFPNNLWIDQGEVCVSGPGLMNGYLRNPEATQAVLIDGMYRSGDLGVLDDEGYLTLVGRTKELVRSGGEFIAPAEVEAVLRTHAGVDDVAIIGLPDPTWHEIVCAVVVPAPGCAPTQDELRRFLDGRLARHKHPRRLILTDALPRTPATGQIQRSRLRALYS